MQIDKFKKLKVLYVEDELDLQKVVANFLFDVVETIDYFSNGMDALEAFKNNTYDLIITDINMPRLNGLELIKKIREFDISVPIIVTTAYDNADYIKDVKAIGMSAYLMKPLDFKDLLKNIDTLI